MNCIGKRNYKYFLGFLISVVLLGIGELASFVIVLLLKFGVSINGEQYN